LTIIFTPTKHRKIPKSFYAETNGALIWPYGNPPFFYSFFFPLKKIKLILFLFLYITKQFSVLFYHKKFKISFTFISRQ